MLASFLFLKKIQDARELEKTNQQKSQSPMIHAVPGSPRIGQLKCIQQESKPSTPVKTNLTNGEPERTENGDQKPENNLTPSVFGK